MSQERTNDYEYNFIQILASLNSFVCQVGCHKENEVNLVGFRVDLTRLKGVYLVANRNRQC